MKNCMNGDDIPYEERVRLCSLSELEDISHHIDREKYSYRYELVRTEIQRRREHPELEPKKRGTDLDCSRRDGIGTGISIVGWLLQMQAVLSFVSVLLVIFFVSSTKEPGRALLRAEYRDLVSRFSLYGPIIWVGMFFLGRGVRRRKEWARLTAVFLFLLCVAVAAVYSIIRGVNLRMVFTVVLCGFLVAFFLHAKVRCRFSPQDKSMDDKDKLANKTLE